MKAENVIDVVIERDLLSVTHPDGAELHFTRQERALPLRRVDNAGRRLPREVLVAAAGGEPASDRHVDFLINQLRRKLRDDARAPRFIRTKYGEGYTWIGKVTARDEKPPLLRAGAVYGEHLRGATALVDSLVAGLDERLLSGRPTRPGEAHPPDAWPSSWRHEARIGSDVSSPTEPSCLPPPSSLPRSHCSVARRKRFGGGCWRSNGPQPTMSRRCLASKA